MKHILLCINFLLLCQTYLPAQSFVFGPKGGFTLGLQSWNGIDREPLLSYHGAIFIESYREGSPSSLFAQIGYHKRGSSEQVFFFTGGGTGFREKQSFEFNNLSALFGAKRVLSTAGKNSPYYAFGVRLEYTLSTNLDQYEIYTGYFPVNPFVNKFNYGATVTFGYEFKLSDLTGWNIEANISPDFSRQYEQAGGFNIISPISGKAITLREQSIRNLTFEVTLGIRLVRKVIYLDD